MEENSEKGYTKYFSFKLFFKKKMRTYYCSKEEDVDKWIEIIRKVTKFKDINNFYEIGNELGKGNFGKVKIGYKKQEKNLIPKIILDGDDISSDREKYAIKILEKSSLMENLHLVKSEIEIMKFCRFKNIVRIQDNFEDHENIYIILEYLSGGDLNYHLSSQKKLLGIEKIKDLTIQLANGVKYLHHFGIIHRDLKPENIMMSDKSENPILKIVDFGLSKVLGKEETSNESYGTLVFAAPEIILKKNYDKAIDIWSLGVITYFLICGNYPFYTKENDLKKIAYQITKEEIIFKGKIWKNISINARDIILKCLERDIRKRINIVTFLDHKWFKE